MTGEESIGIGKEAASFFEGLKAKHQLDDESVLLLILTIAWGWAEIAGLKPRENPRSLFERSARVWDELNCTNRVQLVDREFRRQKDGSFG